MNPSVTSRPPLDPSDVMTPDTPIISIQLGACTVDLNTMEATLVDDVAPITPTEAKLLAYLAKCSGRTITTDELLQVAFGYREGVTSTAVKNTVYRLRKKIETDANAPKHLITVRGRGYRLDHVTFETQRQTSQTARQEIRYTNLPTRTKPLVGRDTVLNELLATCLAGGGLFTLSGPGGIGKTVLAQEVGRQCASELDGGSWFCDLRKATDRASLVQSLESGLEVEPTSGTLEDALEHLGQVLHSRDSLLMILDNAEHLLREVTEIVELWHNRYPHLRLLITSQRALGLPAEQVIQLSTLSVEDGIQLFRESATISTLGKDDATILGQLVTAFDGLPLALELAAKWTDILSPTQLLERQAQRFEYLQNDQVDAHHQTLRAVIERSWTALNTDAQSILRQCARFPAGFTLAMAEAILQLPDNARPVVALVRELIDRSLLFVELESGHRHMYLHQSVRLYIHQMGEDTREAQGFWHRFGLHFSTFGEPSRLRSAQHDSQRNLRDQMVANAQQFELARTHMIAQAHPNEAAKSTLALCFIAGLQRRTHLCFDLCQETLEMKGLDPALRIALQHEQAKTHSDWRAGTTIARALIEELGDRDKTTQGRLWATLGRLHLWNFDLESCEPILTQALNYTLETDDRYTESFVRLMIGILHRLHGQPKRALTELNHALLVANDYIDLRQAEILSQLGRTYFTMGHIRESLRQFEQIVARFGAEQCSAGIHESVATLNVILGNQAEAERTTDRMIQLAMKRGNPKDICNVLSRQAGPLMMAGKHSQALACLEDCITRGRRLQMLFDWQLIMAYDRAEIMVRMKHPDALQASKEAYQQCVEKKHTMQANCALAVARAYHNGGQLEEALEWAQTSLSDAKAKLGQGRALLIIGIVLADLKRTEEAEQHLERTLPLLRAMEATPLAITSVWESALRERLANAS